MTMPPEPEEAQTQAADPSAGDESQTLPSDFLGEPPGEQERNDNEE